jgi:hypothetical protein
MTLRQQEHFAEIENKVTETVLAHFGLPDVIFKNSYFLVEEPEN